MLQELDVYVQKACLRLADAGWADLLMEHGFDCEADDFSAELTKELKVNRQMPGFEDFALEGIRAIEPGKPSYSFLYHALASPNVFRGPSGKELTDFPTLAELDQIENYIYAARNASIADLRKEAGDRPMAVAVFAYEYRPAPETVHRKYADLCFSRTGVARVGNTDPVYVPAMRGFTPFGRDDDFNVLPARYGAFIAVQYEGDPKTVGPMHFRSPDSSRKFWVPLHKLFSGPECIDKLPIDVKLQSYHLNEKIFRIHVALKETNVPEKFPYRFEEGIAGFSENPDFGSHLMMPVPHPLVQQEAFTFKVPENGNVFSSSMQFLLPGKTRPVPEFVYARKKLDTDGEVRDLNKQENDVAETVRVGNYSAMHYVDWTADGWIKAVCPELAGQFSQNVPAYSLITAPDFFFNVSQRELLEWAEKTMTQKFIKKLWPQLPDTLADTRVAPNLNLPGMTFRNDDETVSAIICTPVAGTVPENDFQGEESQRHNFLPDGASGKFAPGWDVSTDMTEGGVEHLAAYGLGSPFPEDAKLCAALSAFWPAVSPDAARTFPPDLGFPTIVPMTDEEIGIRGSNPWDGVRGPIPVVKGPTGDIIHSTFAEATVMEYTDLDYGDYVNSIEGKAFSLKLTGKVSGEDYRGRLLAMARLYDALGVEGRTLKAINAAKTEWAVASFRIQAPTQGERLEAEEALKKPLKLIEPIYRFDAYLHQGRMQHPSRDKTLVRVGPKITAFVDRFQILLKQHGRWKLLDV